MPDTQKTRRFLFNPYLFSLSIFMLIAMSAVSIYLIFYAPVADDRWVLIAFVLFLDALLLAALVSTPVCFGWYTITDDAISLHAPFRRPLTLCYTDVKCIGVGRSYTEAMNRRNDRFIYTPANDFWICLSCDPVPASHLNDMRKLRQTDRALRMPYRPKVFAALHESLPPDLVKQLDRSKTTLRAWGLKDI